MLEGFSVRNRFRCGMGYVEDVMSNLDVALLIALPYVLLGLGYLIFWRVALKRSRERRPFIWACLAGSLIVSLAFTATMQAAASKDALALIAYVFLVPWTGVVAVGTFVIFYAVGFCLRPLQRKMATMPPGEGGPDETRKATGDSSTAKGG